MSLRRSLPFARLQRWHGRLARDSGSALNNKHYQAVALDARTVRLADLLLGFRSLIRARPTGETPVPLRPENLTLS